MTASLERIQRAAERSRSEWGQPVKFRGVTIAVVINDAATVKWADGNPIVKNPKFLPDDSSTVRVLNGTVNPMPTVGESFTDEKNQVYRIQKIQSFKLSYLCLCKVSGPALPPVGPP